MPDTNSTAHADLADRLLREPSPRTVPELSAFLDAIPKRLSMEQALCKRFLAHEDGRAATALAMDYAEEGMLEPRLALSVLLTAHAEEPGTEPLDALRMTAFFQPRSAELGTKGRSWFERISYALRGCRRTDDGTSGKASPAIAAREEFDSCASVIDFILRVEGVGEPAVVFVSSYRSSWVLNPHLSEYLAAGPYDPDRIELIAALVAEHGMDHSAPESMEPIRAAVAARQHGIAAPLSGGWL